MAGGNTDTKDFAKAVAEFETALPGFWWSVGQCSVGAHASCAVDGKGYQADLLEGVKGGDRLDRGFHCDTRGGSPSEALRDVMQQALEFLKPSTPKGASRRRCRGYSRAREVIVGSNTDTNGESGGRVRDSLARLLVVGRSMLGDWGACRMRSGRKGMSG